MQQPNPAKHSDLFDEPTK